VLHAFHSSYSKDEKEYIQDFKLSRRKRIAAQMRMEDKILIETAIKAAKKATEKLMVRALARTLVCK
jgi:RecB family exonuclease